MTPSHRSSSLLKGTQHHHPRELPQPPPDGGTGPDPLLLVAFAARGLCHSQAAISCGLSVAVAERAPETIAATDDVPVRAGWLQQQLRQGPDLAQADRQVIVSKDLAADKLWPDFGRMCVGALGLQSMVSITVPTPEVHSTMNFFSADPGAFDDFDVDAALRLSLLAATSATDELPDIRAAQAEMPGSDFSKVAVALGIIQAQCEVGSPDGFTILREAALLMDRSLFGLAVEVVRLGHLPAAAIAGLRTGRLDLPGARFANEPEPERHVGGPDMWRAGSLDARTGRALRRSVATAPCTIAGYTVTRLRGYAVRD
ncbi:MAG TPA: hypothetical protein VGK18_09255 [Propionicimonas sp.]|uniref:hypothetical protein n=1 Tax=Propionicimonas sp. TaxID=1955623 RepID=UPI002F42286A